MVSPSTARPYRLTLLTSLGLHLLAAAVLWTGGGRSTSSASGRVEPFRAGSAPTRLDALASEVDGIAVDETSIEWIAPTPRPPSGDNVAHPDNGLPGRGGDPSARVQALNLADADDQMRGSPDLLNRLDRDQIQRLHASQRRASWDDRRSTTHPAELALVAVGPGVIHERRPPSPTLPSLGESDSARAREQGAAAQGATVPRTEETGTEQPTAGGRIGSPMERAGAGVRSSIAGADQRIDAPVAETRPSVVQAPVAVPASDRARPSDDVESAQEVATTLRSIIHASAVGGVPGDKAGGSSGGGSAAAGGLSGATSHARSLGDGDVFDFWTDDPTLLPYFRQLHHLIDPLWANAFPKSALLELKQGTVILELTIYKNGRVVVGWPPVRSSGIDEFDRNCADAIRRAAPFPPIPRELGVEMLRIRMPFVARDPIVK